MITEFGAGDIVGGIAEWGPYCPERLYRCLLHPDAPRRRTYDKLGLPVCKKQNIESQDKLIQHMENHHVDELRQIREITL